MFGMMKTNRVKRGDLPKLVAELAAREDRDIGTMMAILLREALMARTQDAK